MFFIVGVMIILSTLIEVAIPFAYKRFFDILSGAVPGDQGVADGLVNIILFVLISQGIFWVFWRIALFVNVQFQLSVLTDVTNSSFEVIHQHSYRFFTNRFVGALVRKANRLVDSLEGIMDRFFFEFLPLAVKVAAILLILLYKVWFIGVIMLAWVFIYVTCIYLFTRHKLKYDEKAAQTDSRVTAQLADTITNSTNVKMFTAFRDEVKRFREVTSEQFGIQRFVWNLDEVLNAFQSGFMVLLEFTIFYVAIRLWMKGVLTVGDFVLIQVYLIQIFTRIWDFGKIVRKIYQNLANAEEMVEILTLPHEIQNKPNASDLVVRKGDIEFRKVGFAYAKTREIIKNFTLSISAGEKVGLVGKSGAGKSTLTALLLRFFDLQEGAIYIDEQNIADVTQESLRRAISLVPQDPILFHRTLKENIRYGRREASDEEVIRSATLAHCDEFIEKLPQGYDTYVGERGIKLSGGERQRVAIARAILKNAPILLLDEATSSLDSHSEALIQDALSTLMENKTVIIVAHRLSTIMKMDRIIVVDEGNIVETGSHTQLLEKEEGIYKQLWDIQAGGFIA